MENKISSEICIKCAECCKNYPFVVLSQHDIFELEKITALPFDAFTNQKGGAVEVYFLDFKKNGECIFLNENNGDYSCNVYESRPAICRKYPGKKSQDEVCDSNRKRIQQSGVGLTQLA